jgi:hypothetical protein
MVGSLKMNTTLEYSTRVVQEGDRRCKKSTLKDLAYLTPLRIPLMNPVLHYLPQVARAGRGVVFPPLGLSVFCSFHGESVLEYITEVTASEAIQ